jgi:hypothetical protein
MDLNFWQKTMKQKFIYKNKKYYLESVAEMKNPTTRDWISCTIYIQEDTGLRFVRETKEFRELFKEV